MLFHSPVFILGFLPICLAGFFMCGRIGGTRLGLGWLVLSSLTFYGWWNPVHVPLLVGSIVINYAIGSHIRHLRSSRAWVIGGIGVNLALLGLFKYADFTIHIFDPDARTLSIALPLAISFFTFQQIMFLSECARGGAMQAGFLHYAAFVTFFPHLIAGPIVQPREIIPQFKTRSFVQPDSENLTQGLTIFLLGLAKKLVLADIFGHFADVGFDAAAQGETITFVEAWCATFAYALQIYFDFSGYCDMAIGLARMFNVRFPLNFRSPYQAHDIADFWRRWHMTLGEFLRVYVYIPLGGNRKRTSFNLIATMLIAGLWHGAAWKFVLWGGIHGALLALHASGRLKLPRVLTLLCIVIAWVPFRADSLPATWSMLLGLAGANGLALPQPIVDYFPALIAIATPVPVLAFLGDARTLSLPEVTACLIVGWFIVLFCPHVHELTERAKTVALGASFALTVQGLFFAPRVAPFLYFQF